MDNNLIDGSILLVRKEILRNQESGNIFVHAVLNHSKNASIQWKLPCRNLNIEEQMHRLKQMFYKHHGYKEGEAVLRIQVRHET